MTKRLSEQQRITITGQAAHKAANLIEQGYAVQCWDLVEQSLQVRRPDCFDNNGDNLLSREQMESLVASMMKQVRYVMVFRGHKVE